MAMERRSFLILLFFVKYTFDLLLAPSNKLVSLGEFQVCRQALFHRVQHRANRTVAVESKSYADSGETLLSQAP